MKQIDSFWTSVYFKGFLCVVAFCIILVLYIYSAASNFDAGYKAACIDFYKGNIKMELKEQPNGELLWVKKEN